MQARRRGVVGLEAVALMVAFATAAPAQGAPAGVQAAAVAKVSNQAGSAGGTAAASPKPPSPQERKQLLSDAVAQLQSTEPANISLGIASLRELAGREAALALTERVRKGLPPQLAELAVDALGSMNQPAAAPVLVELTLHRRWQIRERALVALGALQLRTAVSALLYALDDPSPEVRSAAALALGRLGDPRALPALALALERGVSGAMLALAQLGNARQVELILKYAVKDLPGSEPALRALLTRPNLHVSSKVSVVKAIQGLASPQAEALITSWRALLGKGTDPLLLAALQAQGQKS